MTAAPRQSLIGVSLPRVEDERFVTGRGLYVADLRIEGAVHAAFVRSPIAHGHIRALNLEAARMAPGVIAAFSGRDLVAGGVLPLPCVRATDSADGTPFWAPVRHAIAVDAVRHGGEAVALIIAESELAAIEAVDLVEADYEELPATIDARQSGERAFDWEKGDRERTEAAFRQAARIVEIEAVNNRVLISPLEPRGAVAAYDAASGQYTLWAPSQGVHLIRRLVAPTLGIELERLRVVTNDVGGSFGAKLVSMPEQTALLFAARVLGRPVRWIASRSENQLTDIAGRDHVMKAQLALDGDARILGLKVETFANLGAYASAIGPSSPTVGFAATMCGPYDFQAVHLTVRARYTNTAPTDAYRGSGKPESIYLLERLVERAARETGLDPIEFRRRNLIPAAKMPYRAANGYVYDSADFSAVMDKALELAGWEDFPARRSVSESRGRRRGRGLGLYLHTTGVTSQEVSRVRLDSAGLVVVETGLQSSGQGHETSLAQLTAERLGIALNEVRIEQGDSTRAETGGPTAGSSSLQVGGITILRATEAMLDKARHRAADHLEALVEDVVYEAGHFRIAGTDRRIHLFTLAKELATRGEDGCAGEAALEGNILTIPNGAYVCEVEVDPATGAVAIDRFVGVDDVGRRLNPQLVEGQVHGGMAQGIGQALHEYVRYDPQTGQMLSGTLMDYCLPRADDLPMFTLDAADLPTGNNMLGMKGAGEIGCIGAPAAVINALADAIGHDRIDMPATPERVWRALNNLPEFQP
ncbi:xanthine dehydrogenase family protein molybdopterin-binding subunit [Rhodoligotrophos defluvii]|uniref:xanthine dehydrogenase family protein molybdopterin-binding subunit n=1 Tax=Rhodoligotrophos defluvii TaxID=2561934 RepID=UPI0010C99DD9|nr:xanthine dehydrogenase family protein molybdopterin-binding subunit [Rhodoligotrophos defluvii]